MQYFGTAGNDVFTGTADVDHMHGEAGNDRLDGAGGDDHLHGGLGNDQLIGGDGDDFVNDEDGGSETVDAGIGNDTIHIFHGSAADPSGPFEAITVNAGTGHDFFAYLNYRASSLSAQMGDGDDHVFLGGNRGSITLSLGAGADIVELAQYGLPDNVGTITITDFQTGNSGDRLDWVFFLMSYLPGWSPETNPFATGHMRLIQSGAHSLLQGDRDGGANNFVTLITFQNTTATAFTANNLGGYPRNGGPPGYTITGTAADDSLTAGFGADTLDGLGGNDMLYGRTGNDTYRGGDGNDRMYDDEGGSDKFFGGNGNDYALIQHTSGPANEAAHFDGGTGDDIVSFQNHNDNSSLVALMGDGNDIVGVGTARGAVTMTLGAGADQVELGVFLGDWLGGAIRITDFAVGAAGDAVRLNNFLTQYLINWDGNANPFATKHLRLLQVGADTALQIDRDGGGNAFVTLLTFANVTASALTAFNLDRYSPNGGPVVGDLIVGTAAPDVLRGTFGNDELQGLAGDDQLYGDRGDDKLFGGDGLDFLSGQMGSDSLNGGAGDDTLEDRDGGGDLLAGGDGDDWMTVARLLAGLTEHVRIDGGRGNDRLEYVNYYNDPLTVSMGEGNDLVILHSATGLARVTLGPGADTVKIGPFIYTEFARPIELLDFVPGTAGDALDLFEFLSYNLLNWHPSRNPFGTGHLRLLQSGADTLLQVDRDGGANAFQTLLVFKNVTATALNVDNFGDYPPNGGPVRGRILTGTAARDIFGGGYGADQIDGLGGDDALFGEYGDDTINGGDGNDEIESDQGNDVVHGGAGNDAIVENEDGSDSIYGDDGDDSIHFQHADRNAVETVLLDGGAGNDSLEVIKLSLGTLGIALGAGVDTLQLHALIGQLNLSLGTGADLVEFRAAQPENVAGAAIVADFAAAAGGDRFQWTTLTDYLVGEVAGINPFLTGHLQLVQSGAHSLFQVDQDGGGDSYVTLFTFQNVQAHSFNPTNFTGYLNPVLGTAASETLTGTALADVLWGFAGNDRLDGGNNADLMDGGTGNDTYVVNHAYDRVREAAGAGTDTVLSSVSHVLGANVEHLTLTGASVVNATGNALANILIGNGAANRLDGGAGSDVMKGGLGNDVYVVDVGTDSVQESANEGIDTVESRVNHALAANVERLILTGTGSTNGTGNALANHLTGNSGANRLDGGLGTDAMKGGEGNDTYIVDMVGDTVTELAGQGTDTVNSAVSFVLGPDIEDLVLTGAAAINGTGNGLANRLTGNSAANRLDGAGGSDLMRGGAGDDVYVVDQGGDVVQEVAAAGTDSVLSAVDYVLPANFEQLTLTGSFAVNATGNALANIVTGNVQHNLIDGGAGADVMRGGAGSDQYVVDHAGDVVEEAAGAGVADRVRSSLSYALGDHVEYLALTGAAAIDGTGNASDNLIEGNIAANRLDGGLGADTLRGYGGNDIYIVDNAGDSVFEEVGGGLDLVRSSVSFFLAFDLEDLELTGAAAIDGFGNYLDNRMTGNSAANELDGFGGADIMTGGLGDDIYWVDNAGDQVIELAGEGVDTVFSGSGYTLGAALENLVLLGGGGGIGNDLDNIILVDLFSGFAANQLAGGAGNDLLDGNWGADTLEGGTGSDGFQFSSPLETGVDAILDFSPADDTIFLFRNWFWSVASADGPIDPAVFRTGPAALEADDRIVYDPATGQIFFDEDGLGGEAAIEFATVAAGTPLTAADFIAYGG